MGFIKVWLSLHRLFAPVPKGAILRSITSASRCISQEVASFRTWRTALGDFSRSHAPYGA